MGANNVFEAVLSTVVVPATIGEEDRRATHAEETVGDEHGPLAARIPVIAHHLRAHNHRVVVGVRLQHVPRQVHRYDPRAATHPPQVVAQDVTPHLVVVYDHGRQRRRGVEDAAVDYQYTHVLGTQPGLLEKLVQCSEHDHRRLCSTFFHGGTVLAGHDHRLWDVGFVAYA